MKKFTLTSLGLTLLAFIGFVGCSSSKHLSEYKPKKIVVAYVTSWGKKMPDPTLITHANYAFGHVTDDFKGVRIDNPDQLRELVSLKNNFPHLKVLLSVGGWGSGRFSEMSANDTLRSSFANDCALAVEKFNLDGIDIDWEYPGDRTAGISASPSDVDNFTLLLRDLRLALGESKLLTIATCATPRHYRLKDLEPYVDFVNVMTYDLSNPPKHQSALYYSPQSAQSTCQLSIEEHLAGGIPREKLVMGIPFYGRGRQKPRHTPYHKVIQIDCLEHHFDSIACVPMVLDANGEMMITYDNPKSVGIKCDYVLANGLRGVMFWDINGDDDNRTLGRVIHSKILAR